MTNETVAQPSISIEADGPHGNYCSACVELTFPKYTFDEVKPRLFRVRIADDSFRLCLGCLTQLEEAAHHALSEAR